MPPGLLTINGLIIPAEWDRHGMAIVLSIVTDSFQKFIVANNVIAAELLELIDGQVRVEGVEVGEDLVGKFI